MKLLNLITIHNNKKEWHHRPKEGWEGSTTHKGRMGQQHNPKEEEEEAAPPKESRATTSTTTSKGSKGNHRHRHRRHRGRAKGPSSRTLLLVVLKTYLTFQICETLHTIELFFIQNFVRSKATFVMSTKCSVAQRKWHFVFAKWYVLCFSPCSD